MRWNDRIGRRIKLSDLHILLAVAQTGSMAKAATSSPSPTRSVSRSIATWSIRSACSFSSATRAASS